MVAQQFDGVKDVDFLLQFHLLPNTADRCVQTTLRRAVPETHDVTRLHHAQRSGSSDKNGEVEGRVQAVDENGSASSLVL